MRIFKALQGLYLFNLTNKCLNALWLSSSSYWFLSFGSVVPFIQTSLQSSLSTFSLPQGVGGTQIVAGYKPKTKQRSQNEFRNSTIYDSSRKVKLERNFCLEKSGYTCHLRSFFLHFFQRFRDKFQICQNSFVT